MGDKTRSFGLTGNQLKILALILMTIDHIGCYLLPQDLTLRMIGRLAMPIFAWMVAEGCVHTKSRIRYLLTMLAFGLISQVVSWLAEQSLIQCIFITFSMSILLISVLDLANRKRGFFTLCLLGITMGAICYICVFLPKDIPMVGLVRGLLTATGKVSMIAAIGGFVLILLGGILNSVFKNAAARKLALAEETAAEAPSIEEQLLAMEAAEE